MKMSIILASILLSQCANASIDDFLKGSLSVSGSGPSYTSSQTRGVYSLGEMKVQTGDIGTIGLPIHITAPHISAGCGGIDIGLGGFQFAGQELVDKLKKMAAAAPAFAFQIALNVLCPECAQIMAQLQAMADKLNSMNMDGCQAMQSAANWASGKLTDAISTEEQSGSATGSFMSSVTSWQTNLNNELGDMNKGLAGFQQNLTNLGATPAAAKAAANLNDFRGSIVRSALAGNILFGDADTTEKIVRAITGDVVSDQFEISPTVVVPLFSEDDVYAFVNGAGATVSGISADPTDSDGGVDPNSIQTVKITISQGMQDYFNQQLGSILQKMVTSLSTNTPVALDNTETNFINSMPLPINKILNTEAIKDVQSGNVTPDSTSLDTLSKTLASIEANLLLGKVLGQVNTTMAQYLNANAKFIDGKDVKSQMSPDGVRTRMQENIEKVRLTLNSNLEKEKLQLDQKMKILEYYANLDKQIASKLASTGVYTRRQTAGW